MEIAVDKGSITVKPVKKDFLDFGGSISPKQRPEDFREVRRKTMKKLAESTDRHKK